MAARRRRTTTAPVRVTRRNQSPVEWLAHWVTGLWGELTEEQRRDLGGLLLLAMSVLISAAMLIPGVSWLAGVNRLTLALVGVGWPLLVGGMTVGGVLLLHPTGGKGVQRIQGLASALAGVALLGLLSLYWAPAGGGIGRFLAQRLTQGLGGVGAALVLVASLGLAVIFALRMRVAQVVMGLLVVARARVTGKRPQAVQPRARRAKPAPAGAEPHQGEEREPEGAKEKLAEDPGEEPEDDAEGAGAEEPLDEDDEDEPSPAPAQPRVLAEGDRRWKLPPLDLLDSLRPPTRRHEALVRAQVVDIEEVLRLNGAPATVAAVAQGPTVTRYSLTLPSGVRPKQVKNLMEDLSVAVKATGDLRLEIPIPGTSLLGLEVPRPDRQSVPLRELFAAEGLAPAMRRLGLALGSDVAGTPIWDDLAKMVHLLIAGATGQGKSVCLNALIVALLLQYGPNRLRFLMIDPKRVELKGFSGLPHLACPVIVDPQQARQALEWAVTEMERRYTLLERQDVRNLAEFNARAGENQVMPLPYVVVVIDELADLMMVAKDVDRQIARLGQKARAAGIHLVVATQRPSVDVVTGLIKANVPSRIAFAVDSHVNSGVILGSAGAEKLLGAGDALYQSVNSARPQRLQGAYVSDREIDAVVAHWVRQLHGKAPEWLLQLDGPESVEAVS
jgi:DNA segregation ATPase FtsK/SpoIIIE, S-DNA-T family